VRGGWGSARWRGLRREGRRVSVREKKVLVRGFWRGWDSEQRREKQNEGGGSAARLDEKNKKQKKRNTSN
jgi:hypothetical protein